MVAAAFNHPCVIMWGILNEAHTELEECRPAFERLLNRLRELDATRPVTFADCHHTNCKLFDLPDIIAINCYPGWYVKGLADIPAELDSLIEHVKSIGRGNKPLIISEIGAEAMWGWRDWNQQKWTEQYQSKLLESVIRHLFMKRKDVAGLAIWQFCDIRTFDAQGRARGFNNKGVVDEYRRPKMAYETVKRLFSALRTKPDVHVRVRGKPTG
jgi:beta-glucuronidase